MENLQKQTMRSKGISRVLKGVLQNVPKQNEDGTQKISDKIEQFAFIGIKEKTNDKKFDYNNLFFSVEKNSRADKNKI